MKPGLDLSLAGTSTLPEVYMVHGAGAESVGSSAFLPSTAANYEKASRSATAKVERRCGFFPSVWKSSELLSVDSIVFVFGSDLFPERNTWNEAARSSSQCL
jgi:hypothetical protein